MTQPIDTAYVDIVARDKSLDKMQKDIDKAFDKVDKAAKKDFEAIDGYADDAFREIDKHFQTMEKEAQKSFDAVKEAANKAFDDIDVEVDRSTKRTRRKFREFSDEIDDTFEGIGARVGGTFSNVFSKLGGHLSEIGGGIGLIGSKLAGFAGGSPLIALILALVPAIVALAAALSNLIGLVGVLPSGLGVLIAAIVPVVVAFQNFGDAVSALAEGDIEKIDEALKKLSPSARDVAREVAGLLPLLRSFQRAVQESFFFQIRGGFSQLVEAFPKIISNFGTVATEMGRLTKRFIDFATSTGTIQTLNQLFATTARIISTLSGPIIRLFESITSSVGASLPFVERIAGAFGRALDAFSAFLNKSIETGAFDTFIEDAFTTVKELIDLVKALGGLLGTIFSGTEEAGHGLIVTLTDLTTRLDDFLKSAQGQDALKNLSDLAKLFGQALGAILTSIILLDTSWRISVKTLELLGRGFVDLISKIGDFFGKIPEKIEEFKRFLAQVPAAIVQAVENAFTALLQTIGIQIGLVLFAIQVLPEKIVGFIGTIPQRIRDALASTGPSIMDIFRQAFDDATAFITTKFQEILAFIGSVPSRIAALGPVFLQAGKNLITSFMNGFRAVGSFIGDIAGDIVGSVRSFLNKAIDKINSGIARIDAILPGDLGRIPRLAQGAVVGHRAGGTLAVVGEGREDEAVAPLSKLEDMIKNVINSENGGGTTINFGPASISISFGSVPTEGEARTVGAAVGNSIADQLARRNVRAQVRAA